MKRFNRQVKQIEGEDEGMQVQDGLESNQLNVTLSYTLMHNLKALALDEGVSIRDIALELLAEAVERRRLVQGNDRGTQSMPSHLMTRTGYVPPQDGMGQPSLSHHEAIRATQARRNNHPDARQNNSGGGGRWEQSSQGSGGYRSRHNRPNNQQSGSSGERRARRQSSQRRSSGQSNRDRD